MASQMEAAVLDQVGVDIGDQSKQTGFRATGSVIAFDGFIRLYREGMDDSDNGDDDNRILPAMNEGDALQRGNIMPEQHFTQPPPRYSEASW